MSREAPEGKRRSDTAGPTAATTSDEPASDYPQIPFDDPEPPPEDPWIHKNAVPDTAEKGSVLREYQRVMFRFSHLGLNFGIAIGLGFLLGRLGDNEWGTDPWLTVAGVLLGLGAGVKEFLKFIRYAKRKMTEDVSDAGSDETSRQAEGMAPDPGDDPDDAPLKENQ